MANSFVSIRVEITSEGIPEVTLTGDVSNAKPDDRVMLNLVGYGLFGMLEDDHMEVAKYGVDTLARMHEEGRFAEEMEGDEEITPTHAGTMRAQ
jgi:hypothetical protein